MRLLPESPLFAGQSVHRCVDGVFGSWAAGLSKQTMPASQKLRIILFHILDFEVIIMNRNTKIKILTQIKIRSMRTML